ncbi:MAG: VIT domain-containing protein [bacterium]
MKKQRFTYLVLATLTFTAMAFADGIIIPPPGVNISVKYHHVTVDINDQIVHTEIDQVFLNDTDIDSVEGIYIFPLPKDASFSSFSMFVDGEELTAKIYDADSARVIYESIVRRNLDPALLEYVGRGLFQARVYPILAKGEKRIKISYSELLNYDSDIYRYLYPLSTEKFSSKPLEDVSVNVTLASSNPIKTIYSPSHPIVVQKSDDYNATITYTEENVKPDRDFILYYTVSSDDIGMNVMAYNDSGEDGFYIFMAAPKLEIEETEVVKKRMLFVLDRSGSMSGEKILQAKEALRFCVNNLNTDDLFNMIDFSSDVRQFKTNPVAANSTNIQEALSYIDRFTASGGTNINDALLTALSELKQDSFSNMIIFLTDGQPTVGETDNETIRQNVKNANTYKARLFVFGVGFDVNTHLLDNLSLDNHGVSTYVRPDENIEVAVSSFFNKISNPVLTNISLDYENIAVHDYFPKELPDLFKGSQLIEFGRYSNSGNTTITLSGDVNGTVQSFQHNTEFPAENLDNEFIPRLWATRKVGYLLNEIRLNGETQELIDEIVALGKRYGIITPYTSFLILEDNPSGDNFSNLSNQTGESAVSDARSIGNYRGAVNPAEVMSKYVRYVGNKTFFMRDSFWVDSEFNGNVTIFDVEFSSNEYFDLLKNNTNLGQYFAIGKNLVVSLDNIAYKVHEPGKDYTVIPEEFILFQNYPNPFNPETTIQYFLSRASHIKIAIFDILGREVKVLVNGFKSAGYHFTEWDGKNSFGREAASGIYFYKLSTERSVQVKKMAKVK